MSGLTHSPRSVQAPRWRRYLRFWRSNITADLDDELEFHVLERVDELVAQGMSPAAARDEALRTLGDVAHLKRTCRELATEREAAMQWSERITVLRQDVVYALRVMRANPTFASAIVITLALGIGATTAIFSVVNAVLLRPLPYDEPDKIAYVLETIGPNGRGRASVGHFTDWTNQSRSFAATAAWIQQTVNLTDGDPQRIIGARVTPGFFRVQHMTPAMGRYFLPSETADSRVAVMSYPLWETRFARDPAIVGKEVTLNGLRHTVIGVTPKAFTLTNFDEQLWTPLTFAPQQLTNYGAHNLLVFARLKPGVTMVQAQDDIVRVTDDIRRRQPDQMVDRGAAIDPVAENRVRGYRRQLWVLLGAVSFVLLIGCGNVASLLLARAMTRRKEIAIRAAIGGSRGRLVGQLLTESGIMAVVGGGLGLLVAQLGIGFLKGMGPAGLPRLGEAGLNWEVLLFAAGATLLCGTLFGLAPALRATRVDLQTELRDGGRGSRGAVSDRLRGALIVTEIAVALVLLVSASLFIRSALRLQSVATGFEPAGVTMMRVALPAARYDSALAVHSAFTRIVNEVRAIPGVDLAASSTRVPMWGPSIDIGVRVDGRPRDPKRVLVGHVRLVTNDFFETIGMAIKSGRSLREGDVATGAPWTVVVNETFARTVFPDGDAIGKRISGWAPDTAPEWREIVGIVGDVRAFGREVDAPPEIYMPLTQAPANAWPALQRTMTVVAVARPGATIAPAMRAAVRRVDAELPVFNLQTMDAVLSNSVSERRFNTWLLSFLGLTGLILAAIGVYGVITFFVSQRTHEIGVRVALGASSGNVVSIVVRQALVLAGLGILVGAVAAFWATRVLDTLLFDVKARDPVAFAAGAVVLLLAALGASWFPARRAARVPAMSALSSAG